jgi:hypothetical protein
MSGFLYYLPGRSRSIKLPEVKRLGLGYAFEERMTPNDVYEGPDQRKGVILVDPGRTDRPIGYVRDQQEWRKIPKRDAWLGWWRDSPPGPADLVRRRVIPGHSIEIGGQRWECPIARAADEDNGQLHWFPVLPVAMGLDEEGNWVRNGTLPQYARLWQIACDYWNALTGATPESEADGKSRIVFNFSNAADAALCALATNYRVDRAEVAALGLFDEQTVREILQALVDWPTVEEFAKKKARQAVDSSSSDAGPPAEEAATVQPSPTFGP